MIIRAMLPLMALLDAMLPICLIQALVTPDAFAAPCAADADATLRRCHADDAAAIDAATFICCLLRRYCRLMPP